MACGGVGCGAAGAESCARSAVGTIPKNIVEARHGGHKRIMDFKRGENMGLLLA
jgi:hypothetical protein